MSPLCSKCGSLDVSQTHEPPRPVARIALPYLSTCNNEQEGTGIMDAVLLRATAGREQLLVEGDGESP
jgi:hypothetical protein